ncbi:MAG: hypothetical protein ABGX28_02420 [Methylococcales bacterium]
MDTAAALSSASLSWRISAQCAASKHLFISLGHAACKNFRNQPLALPKLRRRNEDYRFHLVKVTMSRHW